MMAAYCPHLIQFLVGCSGILCFPHLFSEDRCYLLLLKYDFLQAAWWMCLEAMCIHLGNPAYVQVNLNTQLAVH